MEGPLTAGICVFIEFIVFICYIMFASNNLRKKIIKMGRLIPAVQVVVVNAPTTVIPGTTSIQQAQYQNVQMPQPYGQPQPQAYGQPQPQAYEQGIPEYEYEEVPPQPYSQTAPPSYGLVPPPAQPGWQAPMEVPPPYTSVKKY